MNRYIVTIIFILCCLLKIDAQSLCIQSVKDICDKMSSTQLPIKIGNAVKGYSYSDVFGKMNKSQLRSLIDMAEVFSYGNPLDSVVILNIGDRCLYFRVNTESPIATYEDILNIYDETGNEILYKGDKLLFAAVIDDPDGFVNIRSKPSKGAKIVNKIMKNQVFFYFPVWGTRWCKVYIEDGGPCVGYIYHDRILPYEKCTPEIKKKIEHILVC